MKGTITFFRHGQTDDNIKKAFCGSTDTCLNEAGRAQVRDAAQALKNGSFDLLVYGGKLRVRQSAEILMEELCLPKASLDGRIREIDFGAFEGLTADEAQSRYPGEWKKFMADWVNYTFPGGENTLAYFLSCGQFVRGLFHDFPGSNILVVAHRGFILCSYASYLHMPPGEAFNIPIDNAQTLLLFGD